MNAAQKITALREAMLTRPGPDEDYGDVVLEHEDGSSGLSESGAAAARTILNATPQLIALIEAASRKHGRSGNISTRCFCGDVWPCREDAALTDLDRALGCGK